MSAGSSEEVFAVVAEGTGDGTIDLVFGTTVILLIAAGYLLHTLWLSFVPKRNALLRSLSCPSLKGMTWSARTACITMLAEFDARSDPIAAAAKEAKSQREVAKKTSMPRVASLPTLVEEDDKGGARSIDDWAVPVRKSASLGGVSSRLPRVASLPAMCPPPEGKGGRRL